MFVDTIRRNPKKLGNVVCDHAQSGVPRPILFTPPTRTGLAVPELLRHFHRTYAHGPKHHFPIFAYSSIVIGTSGLVQLRTCCCDHWCCERAWQGCCTQVCFAWNEGLPGRMWMNTTSPLRLTNVAMPLRTALRTSLLCARTLAAWLMSRS